MPDDRPPPDAYGLTNLSCTRLAYKNAGRYRSNIPKQCVKTDYQILATAVVHRAQLLVTAETKHFRQLAGDKIRVEDVPEVHEQTALDLNP